MMQLFCFGVRRHTSVIIHEASRLSIVASVPPGPSPSPLSRGMLTPKAVMDFRKDNPLTLTRGSSARKKDPLPSDGDATFKYGRPSERRLEEEIRRTG